MKLSFILPCYNVERYITDCLNSIYSQNLSEDDFEVICVNDCSTDGTRAVIENYASHSNLTLIDHAENLTAGGARNTGIKVAKGEYIWFVDPDDMVNPNCLHELYTAAASKSVDILMFNFSVVDENLNPIHKKDVLFCESEILSGQEFVMKYTPGNFSAHCMVWRCLFKTSFLREKSLYYPIMRKAQDVSFLWKVLLYADRVGSVENSYYIYRSNPYSVARKLREARVAFSNGILWASRIVDMMMDKRICIAVPLAKDMLKSLKWCVNSSVEVLCKMTINERVNYYSEIVSHKKDVKKVVPYMNRKNRLVFSTFLGKYVWIKKVQLICFWEKRKKCR